jgi:hypothetical protein
VGKSLTPVIRVMRNIRVLYIFFTVFVTILLYFL